MKFRISEAPKVQVREALQEFVVEVAHVDGSVLRVFDEFDNRALDGFEVVCREGGDFFALPFEPDGVEGRKVGREFRVAVVSNVEVREGLDDSVPQLADVHSLGVVHIGYQIDDGASYLRFVRHADCRTGFVIVVFLFFGEDVYVFEDVTGGGKRFRRLSLSHADDEHSRFPEPNRQLGEVGVARDNAETLDIPRV